MKPYEELTIKDDYMFGVVMRDPEICKECLQRILGVTITNISYPEEQKQLKFAFDQKAVRMDIYVEGIDTVYNIEMQTSSDPFLPKRTRYYQSMLDNRLLDKGEFYGKIKNSIVIFICDFDLFGEDKYIYRFRNRSEDNPDLALNDGREIIFLNTKGNKGDISQELKSFIDFIESGSKKDSYTEVIDGKIKEAKKRDTWRKEYMTFEQAFEQFKFHYANLANETWLQEGREEGLAKGREEGMIQGREEGLAKGREEGMIQGREEGMIQGREEGKLTFVKQLISDGILTVDQAVEQYNFNRKDLE